MEDVWLFSNMPPWYELVPLFEIVVISLMPPNSAELLTSLTRISAMVSNDGKSSLIGAAPLGLIVLMPSRLEVNMAGLAPATERLPLASVSTPGCVVNVVMALVDPLARE